LQDANFSRVNLDVANLTGANLEGTDFTDARFNSTTKWPDGFDPLTIGAHGPGVDYSGEEFVLTMRNRDLRGANFEGARIGGSRTLVGTNLTDANLRDANFSRVNLDYANLTGADLKGTNLREIKYNSQTDWTGAIYSVHTQWPEGFDPVAKGAILVDSSYGLVAYFPFDGNAQDHSGNENHSKVVGATLSTDRLGNLDQAYDFDQKNYITVEDDSGLNVSSAVTVSAWIAPPLAGFPNVQNWWEKMWIVGKNRDITSGYHLFIGEGGLLQGWVVAENNGSSTSFLLPENKDWSHCVLTYSEKKGGALYYNGKLVDSSEAAGPIICYDEKEGFSIGRLTTFNLFHFKGKIDEVRIYDRTLSADEVTELYELEKPVEENSPTVKVPDFVPTGPGIDYEKKYDEALARLEALKILDKKADLDIAQRRVRLAKLDDELSAADKSLQNADVSLAACEKECEGLAADLRGINGAIGVEDAKIYGLNGKIGASEKQFTDLENDKSKLEEDLAEAERKGSVPHTPGWHFIDGKGWLWTSPDYFPLVYSEQVDGWMYYESGSQAPWLYFDYNTESWQEW
jgi:hypothetical protein